MAGALMQLRNHADHLASRGRHGDTELVHMSPREVRALEALHPEGELPRNPDTGLPEAFDLGGILGSVGGALLPVLLPEIGGGVGEFLGLTDLLGPDLAAGVGGGLLGGALGGLGSLIGGGSNPLMYAGLGALGGGLTSYFSPEISGALGTGGNAGGLLSSLFSSSSAADPWTSAGSGAWDTGGGDTDFTSGARSSGTGGLLGGGSSSAGASGSSWLGRNWPLLAGGLLLASMAGGKSSSSAKPPAQTQAQKDSAALTGSHAQNYALNRTRVPTIMDPTQWYTLDNQNSGRPITFFDNPAGTYTPIPGPVTGLANGGAVGYAKGGLSAMRDPRYIAGPQPGQSDTVPARLSDGEYVLDAATVADLGDGNNNAGARKLDGMRRAIAKHKGRSRVVPPKAKALTSYLDEGAR